jgi:hypothetical protein
MNTADESLLLPTCHEPFVFFLGTTDEVYASTLNATRAFAKFLPSKLPPDAERKSERVLVIGPSSAC